MIYCCKKNQNKYINPFLKYLQSNSFFSLVSLPNAYELYIYINVVILNNCSNAFNVNTQGFAENLFKLFDSDCSGAVSLQELVGGLGRLTV